MAKLNQRLTTTPIDTTINKSQLSVKEARQLADKINSKDIGSWPKEDLEMREKADRAKNALIMNGRLTPKVKSMHEKTLERCQQYFEARGYNWTDLGSHIDLRIVPTRTDQKNNEINALSKKIQSMTITEQETTKTPSLHFQYQSEKNECSDGDFVEGETIIFQPVAPVRPKQ